MVRIGIVVVVALMALAGAPAAAPAAAGEAFLSRRVVHVFDFDERDKGNFGRLPRYWFVVRAVGYPRHTADLTEFDDAHAVSGERSLRMKSNGGSAAVVLRKGAIAAIPGADYVVSVQVRTERAEHARARMIGMFLDDSGRPIADSRAASDLIATDGRWQRAKLQLRGDHDDAAWIVLRLELLQSEQFRDATLGPHELYREDIGAIAWFDDVAIFQLPRIELASDTPTNVIRRPEAPKLNLTVRDLTGEKLTAHVRLYDEAGELLDQQRRVLDGRHAPRWTWSPKIDRLGWCWADLRVSGERGLVGRRAMAFAWLPANDGAGAADARRFGIVAEGLPAQMRGLLPAMVDAMGIGAVIADVWRADMSHDELKALEAGPDAVIEQLIARRLGLTLSLAEAPRPLAEAARTDADKPLSLFDGDEKHWAAALRATLVRYGQSVNRWQIGRSDSDEAFWRDDLPELTAALRSRLAALVPDAKLVLPWSAQREGPAADRAPRLTLHVPASVRPEHVAAHLKDFDPARTAVVLEALDPARFDHRQRAEDLALRVIEAWRADPAGVYIAAPWNRADSRATAALPDPLLAVFANLADRLGERRIVGQMPLGERAACYILDGPAGGALVAWATGDGGADAELALFLGDAPVAIDLWGNRAPLASRDGRHQLKLGTMPLFVEGIDAKLARFRASLRFTPAFLESSHRVHQVALHLHNPWPTAISGKLRLDGQEDWKIQPRLIDFNIPAGDSLEVPVNVTFPISELAGRKRLTAALVLDADRRYALRVAAPLTIGLKDIEFHPTLSVEAGPAGNDVVITAIVTNRGQQPRSLYAFAMASDVPRQQRIIAQLGPGQSTIKRFRLPGAADRLAGESVRVGLREMDGAAMLNQKLQVP